MREINDKGLALLKQFEGRRLVAYQDQGGVWTIGYGCTGPDVVKGLSITAEEAEKRLHEKLLGFYHLDDYISEHVNDNQYSALICLAYNIGLRAIKMSTLLRCINNNTSPDKEWLKWNHVNGIVNAGLTRRRQAELELYHELR